MVAPNGEVSKAGYYKWRKSRSKRSLRLEEDLLLKERLLAIHKIHPYFGYKRMTRSLSREGIMVDNRSLTGC
jgi:putative transposase